MNIAIIGAGPIGGYAGYLLAQAGHSVALYENHAQVGCPIQCTGILTSDFDEFNLPLDSYLVNVINTIEVYTPTQKLSVKQKDYIVNRTRFDQFFVTLAQQAGAQLYVNPSFLRREGNTIIIKDSVAKTEQSVTPDLIIGADGPLSPTAKAFGLFHPQRQQFYGIQATVEGNFEPHTIKTYFGNKVCPGLFAWIVPESAQLARVGLATTKNTKYYFDRFLKEHHFTATDMQAGTIPIYHPQQRLQQQNCYLAGDAASYVKATTLGGLVPGLQQAKILVESILAGKKYEREIKPVRKKMWLHLRLHTIFNKFTDQDWDRLVRYLNQSGAVRFLEQHTRDNPYPILFKTILKEPRFLYFLKYVL